LAACNGGSSGSSSSDSTDTSTGTTSATLAQAPAAATPAQPAAARPTPPPAAPNPPAAPTPPAQTPPAPTPPATPTAPAGTTAQPTALDTQLRGLINAQNLSGNPVHTGTLPNIKDPLPQRGMRLFFSRSLSGEFESACVSCHHPDFAGTDQLSLSVGV